MYVPLLDYWNDEAAMAKPIDTFWLDLKLNHDSCDPKEITDGLGIQPSFSARSGQVLGSITRISTVWMCHFREGIGDDVFVQALESLLSFFDHSTKYLEQFKASGGEIEIEVNQAVGMDDGILFNLHLDYEFLKTCGERGISLRVQAWSADNGPR
jgi:hypothetical protein